MNHLGARLQASRDQAWAELRDLADDLQALEHALRATLEPGVLGRVSLRDEVAVLLAAVRVVRLELDARRGGFVV